MMHDGDFLYLAVRSRRLGYGSICVAEDDEISILHASAALGTAVFEKDQDGWQRTRQFEWCCRSTEDSPERQAHLKEEGWMASTGNMGSPNEMEYQIATHGRALTLAVVYQQGPNRHTALWWPKNLDDGCLELVSIPDDPPERLSFEPGAWVTIIPSTD